MREKVTIFALRYIINNVYGYEKDKDRNHGSCVSVTLKLR